VIKKSSYGEYSSGSSKVHTTLIKIGELSLWFSFDEVVAFKYEKIREVLTDEEIKIQIEKRFKSLGYNPRMFICKNIWEGVTARHIDFINPDQSIRLEREKFVELLNRVLDYCNLSGEL